MIGDRPANLASTLDSLAPIVRRPLRDRVSPRAAIALVGGASVVLWTALIAAIFHFTR